MTTKLCTHCGEEKEIDCFNKQATGKLGVRSYCRACQSRISKEYKATDKAMNYAKHTNQATKEKPPLNDTERTTVIK